jgi:hypothetical protein
VRENISCIIWNGLAFVVSELQFGNFSLKKAAFGDAVSTVEGYWEGMCTSGLPDGLFFQTKNPNLGKFLRALERMKLVYSMVIWIYYVHLV